MTIEKQLELIQEEQKEIKNILIRISNIIDDRVPEDLDYILSGIHSSLLYPEKN